MAPEHRSIIERLNGAKLTKATQEIIQVLNNRVNRPLGISDIPIPETGALSRVWGKLGLVLPVFSDDYIVIVVGPYVDYKRESGSNVTRQVEVGPRIEIPYEKFEVASRFPRYQHARRGLIRGFEERLFNAAGEIIPFWDMYLSLNPFSLNFRLTEGSRYLVPDRGPN